MRQKQRQAKTSKNNESQSLRSLAGEAKTSKNSKNIIIWVRARQGFQPQSAGPKQSVAVAGDGFTGVVQMHQTVGTSQGYLLEHHPYTQPGPRFYSDRSHARRFKRQSDIVKNPVLSIIAIHSQGCVNSQSDCAAVDPVDNGGFVNSSFVNSSSASPVGRAGASSLYPARGASRCGCDGGGWRIYTVEVI